MGVQAWKTHRGACGGHPHFPARSGHKKSKSAKCIIPLISLHQSIGQISIFLDGAKLILWILLYYLFSVMLKLLILCPKMHKNSYISVRIFSKVYLTFFSYNLGNHAYFSIFFSRSYSGLFCSYKWIQIFDLGLQKNLDQIFWNPKSKIPIH